jgi:hypothetical protein
MPVTITAGITFSGGGLTMSLPPSVATAGWYSAGQASSAPSPTISTTSRVTYATDTATATTRGPLSGAKYNIAATGTLTYGWYTGGVLQNGGSEYSTVDRITFTTDTGAATTRGPLNTTRQYHAAVTDGSTYGWYTSGYANGVQSASVGMITYATDTSTATSRGSLNTAVYWGAGTGTTTSGWIGGGIASSPTSVVQRITYATDTATASVKGPLSVARAQLAAVTDSTTYGWFGGGASDGSTVDRITYATDTATATARGPLSLERQRLAASTDNTYGWFGAGLNYTSRVDRITYATDTATASVRGPLTIASFGLAATAGIQ